MSDLRTRSQQFLRHAQLRAIYLRPARGVAAVSAPSAQAQEGLGLIGDRHSARRSRSANGLDRQVTLLQAEHLPLIAAWLGRAHIDAALLRRNLVIEGINLIAMRALFADQVLRWRIGAEVEIELTGPCAPCSHIEDIVGPGAYNALRGHGGMNARILRSGTLRVGDTIHAVEM